MKKIKVGIIGTGNIGSDLLYKVQRSPFLEIGIFTGQNRDSIGIKRAQKMGVKTSFESIKAITDNPSLCEIVFDASNASSHLLHAPILSKLKKFTIDMTPSRVGKMCVPVLNLDESLKNTNVNMITCGGQATIPLLSVIKKVHPSIEYFEIVSSVASNSAGIGTRDNIDEYTQSTSDAIKLFTGVKKAKAIMILNPADPPIIMHNTMYALMENPNLPKLKKEIEKMAAKLRKYVPGFKLVLGPVYENNRLTVASEVVGRGDFLPVYAGNLDIINCAAIEVAEEYAKRQLTINR